MSPARLAFVVFFLAAVAFASRARADEGSEAAVVLDYEAPGDCEDRASFVARVQRHSARAVFVATGEPHLRIAIKGGATGFDGALSYAASARSLHARSCKDLGAALALVAALAIDPDAHTAADPEPSAPQRVPPESSLAPLAIAPPELLTRESPPREESTAAVGSALLFTRLHSGLFPDPGLGAGAGVALEGPRTSGLRAHVEISADVTTSRGLDSGAVATFDAVLVALATCPVGTSIGRRLDLAACANVRGGALHGQGAEIAKPVAAWAPWLEGGLGGRARFGSGRWFAMGEVGLAVHVTRPRFRFEEPFVSIYEVPWGGFRMSAGAGFRFR
jgi:hypothetical protein